LGERSSSAVTPSTAPIDPVPAGLRDDVADLLARVLELQNKIVAQKEDAQPAQAQPPPNDDASVRVYTVSEVAKLLRLGLSRTYQHLQEGLIPRAENRRAVAHPASGVGSVSRGQAASRTERQAARRDVARRRGVKGAVPIGRCDHE
jgi:hypothetical protein